MQEPIKKKVIVAFKTHFDIGFTELYEEFISRMSGEMLCDAINTREDVKRELNADYVWTMPAWPLLKTLEKSSSAIAEKAKDCVRDGQIIAHGLPFTLHTETASVEDLVYAVRYVDALVEKYEMKSPISAKMTDVPGHTWFLVSALCSAGIKFLHLGCNPAAMPADVPRLFWWEAPDGKRILTFYSKGEYGSALIPPSDWEFPVWLALQQTNDNKGPHKVDEIKDMFCALADYDVKLGSLDDFYFEISKCDLSSLPVIKKDLADSWIHGVGSYPKEVGELRRARNKLNGLSRLNCLAGLENENTYNDVNELFDIARENSLLFSEHTWGLSVIATLGPFRKYKKDEFIKQRTTLPYYARIEKSWDDQRNFTKKVTESAKNIADIFGGVVGENVFNPNANVYTGLVELPAKMQGAHTFNGRNYGYVENLQPLSCEKLKLSKLKDSIFTDFDEYVELKNSAISLRINKLTGFFDLYKNGVLLMRNSGRYVYDVIGIEQMTEFVRKYIYRFYDWAIQDFARSAYPEQETISFTAKCDNISYQDGKIVVRFIGDEISISEYGDVKSLEVEYMIVGENLRVGLKLCGKEASPYLESGNFIFNFVDNTEYYINKTGSVISPVRDICNGCNKTYFCLEKYFETVGGTPLRVYAEDSPLISIGEDGCYKVNEQVNKSSLVFFNLFNNMWGTNFPQWNEGDFTFDYTIQTDISSTKFNLMPFVTDVMNVKSVIDSLPTGIELESLQELNGKLFALLRETRGLKTNCVFNFHCKSVIECDFKGNAIGDLQSGGDLTTAFNAYEIKAVLIEL